MEKPLEPSPEIDGLIFLVRGQRVLVDRDLAQLYGVPTKALNQAVRRNLDRFPDGFMFRLTPRETAELVMLCDRFRTLKHASAPPLVFTDFGVAMLSSVLRSERAVKVNVRIIQTFIRLRRMAASRDGLVCKVEEIDKRTRRHERAIGAILRVVERLDGDRDAPVLPRRRIGFQP